MSVTAARITGVKDTVLGTEKVRTRRLTFASNYATGGEAVAASLFGLRKITRLIPHGGVAMASALSTGCPVSWDAANGKLVFFEGAAAASPLPEKNNAEAHISGAFIDVTVFGT